MRRIKNRDKLKKEDLIISSNAERNYMKHLNNNNTNVDNNSNTNVDNNSNTNDDDTYDSKIRDIRMILSRLGNIVTNKGKKKTKKELCEIEKKAKPFR